MTPRLVARGLAAKSRLRGVELEVGPREVLVLLGPNGAGKSSLLAALLGDLHLDAGSVDIGSTSLLTCSAKMRSTFLAWLPQRPIIPEGLSTRELVALGRFRFGEPEDVAGDHALALLEERNLGHLASRPARSLSGGELQRALLATVIAQETPYLLVDEPSNHLDPKQQKNSYSELGALRESGRGLIVATHDLRLARLLDHPSRVTVIGLEQGAPRFVDKLDSPSLAGHLEDLFGVRFREGAVSGDWFPEFSDAEQS